MRKQETPCPEKSKKLRILAASDLHGESKLAQALSKKAEKENVDLVILCGDTTSIIETSNIIKPFKDRKQKILIIPGNHESFATVDMIAQLYGIKNLHGYSAVYKDVGIFGAGGADIGISGVTDKQMLKTLKKAHSGLRGIEKKIMITHMHPEGGASEIACWRGSKAIKQAVKLFKPQFLLHGHIHETFGLENKIGNTRVINVGRDGKIIEI